MDGTGSGYSGIAAATHMTVKPNPYFALENLIEGHGAPEANTIRFVLHPGLCRGHKIMDEHWVEVYTGISWINWHMKLFSHMRNKRR